MGKFFDRVDIQWSWGRHAYDIHWEARSIKLKVHGPTWTQRAKGQIYTLPWSDGTVCQASLDEEERCVWILRDAAKCAKISAYPDELIRDAGARKGEDARELNDAMVLYSKLWNGYSTGRYRVRNRAGKCLSFPQLLSCRFGGASSRMLVRRDLDVSDAETLVAIGVCVTTMFGSVDSPWE